MSQKRRHSTGFGYIGFGNSQASFNRKSKTAFSEYKQKLDLEAHLHYKMHFLHKDLTKEDKQHIKEKIRAEERKLNKLTMIISIMVFTGLGCLVYYLVQQILSR